MKIAKKDAEIKSSAEPEAEAVEELDPEYAECIDYIKSAINCLCPKAKQSIVAKEAIANLSVVLLDLQ